METYMKRHTLLLFMLNLLLLVQSYIFAGYFFLFADSKRDYFLQ